MIFILLDHLLTGALAVIALGVASLLVDMLRYVVGGDHD